MNDIQADYVGCSKEDYESRFNHHYYIEDCESGEYYTDDEEFDEDEEECDNDETYDNNDKRRKDNHYNG